MEVQEILEQLESYTGVLPREAIREAVAHREEITPELLRILVETVEHIEVLDTHEYMAPEWAMFLLAQFREERAYPLIVDLVSGPANLIDDALGETISQYLNRVLASVYDGDMGPLDRLIEDPEVNEYVRSAALDALVVLAATGRKPREEVIAYYRSLFDRGFGPDEATWTWLVYSAAALAPGELMDEIRRAFEEHPVDSFIIDLNEVERSAAEGWDAALMELQQDQCRQLIDDVEKETSWWACWQPREAPRPAPKPPAPAPTPAPQGRSASLDTYVRPGRKVGRNEPCPCGSGKKYKKCCGA